MKRLESREEKAEWKGAEMARCPEAPSRHSRQVEKACPLEKPLVPCSVSLPTVPVHIVSPTFGYVVCVSPARGRITLYIPRNENHSLFSPLTGVVSSIRACQGTFYRPELEFVSEHKKDGRLAFFIRGPHVCLDTWIEVGGRSYVTHRVRLTVDQNDSVKAGKQMGEIVLGSLAEIRFPSRFRRSAASFRLYYQVKVGQKVQGGKTIVATLKA